MRKLDQLPAVHLNQQHNIRWQLRHLPREIADVRQTLEHLQADIVTRDAHDEFVMAVGLQVFSPELNPRLYRRTFTTGVALVESVNPQWKDLRMEKTDKSRLAARDPSASVGMTEKRTGTTNRKQAGNSEE